MYKPTEGFDPVYMKILLDRVYQMAPEGYPWEKAQPGVLVQRMFAPADRAIAIRIYYGY